ncbi:protein FAM200A-like [Scylla paramamosain]|uniref:protein FAM200A-like n=1 Tax=Scylla paramamosain TaxID=85552 RepID=UPI0030839F02
MSADIEETVCASVKESEMFALQVDESTDIGGFVSLVKKENSSVITTHCFLHREALVAKTIGNDLKSVLEKVVKMVNFIKSRPLKTRLFAKLCEEVEAKHVNLLLHTELTGGLTLTEEEQLVEMRNDRNLKLLHMQLPLNEFWVQMKAQYPQVAKKALVILIQFSTSYLFVSSCILTNLIKFNKY